MGEDGPAWYYVERQLPYRDRDGQLVGRINLNRLIRGAFQSASVGYLLDQHMTGRGIATAALRQVIDIAFSALNLHRLQAETLTDNPASQAVLRRCGFVHYGRAPDYLKIDGRWQTNDLFQLINPDYPPSRAAPQDSLADSVMSSRFHRAVRRTMTGLI